MTRQRDVLPEACAALNVAIPCSSDRADGPRLEVAGLRRVVYGEFYRDERIFSVAERLAVDLLHLPSHVPPPRRVPTVVGREFAGSSSHHPLAVGDRP